MPNPAAWFSQGEPDVQAVACFVDPSTGAENVVNTSQGLPVRLYDQGGSTGATVAQFHNADNQSLGGAANGLYTGGVAQLLNAKGNLDRQAETWADNRPNLGISSGATQNAMPIVGVTIAQTVTGSGTGQPVTLSATSGTNRGAPWNIAVGHVLQIGGANPENVYVTAVSGATVTGVFALNHSNGDAITAFVYNQQRDATLADGSTPAGVSASSAYFWNGSGMEIERSANGERDGASGAGTAVAAEYEYNGGGPLLNTGLASGLNYDRARNLQAKGVGTATQNAGGAAGATSITASSAAATNTLQPGQQIRIDRNTGSEECAYVSSSYVPGTAAITLQSALQFTHTAAAIEWDIFASAGPGLNGFTPAGIGIEEEALFNPVDGKYYIERSATQDAAPAANVVLEAPGLWNGATMDRQRSNMAVTVFASAAQTTTQTSADQLNVNGHCLHVILNVTSAGTGSVTLSINGKDPASGVYYNLLTGVAVTTNSTNVYKIGPALTAAANAVANDWVPRTFQIVVTANNSNSMTYSVGYNLSE